ncbi:MAG: iron-sulfur cluster assembly scaffold protein [Immundisolibacterales bacterium]|nr:iron-sulfur cluster assembly scaffold protein [Immundisolibacterales bacterium]
MADLPYHAAILGAAHRASGKGRLEAPDSTATVDNPLCGDRVTIDIRWDTPVRDANLREIGQVVRGCVLCEAAAALIVEVGTGAAASDLRHASDCIRRMLEEGAPPPPGDWKRAEMFVPVRAHPSRHDCVLLPFQALLEALDGG